MIWIKRIGIVLLLAVIGSLIWSWQAGPIRMKRDISGFAEKMGSCSAFNQDFKDLFSGKTMNRAIAGPEDDTCVVRMQTYSPQILQCSFAMEDVPELARAFARQADNIGFFGGWRVNINTQNPDPWQRIMNNPACKMIEG
ncbi:hypothetical protein MNBD_ALPHA07-1156 [hydrothermal vent metagenome]|uniref:Uncharacterized protein n=1 Tax=hydrothermal vent metagenome TaxID=652676 RepID=A0A3B0RM43_9ZZZZ